MSRRREERRRRREEKRRSAAAKRRAAGRRPGAGAGLDLGGEGERERGRAPTPARADVELAPPGLERCAPPLHLDGALQRVEDPLARLCLTPDEARDPERVRAAWRRGIEAHPPERDPEVARLLTAARDRLLAPDQVLARHLGVLHPPDPAAHGLPAEPARAKKSVALSAHARLLPQLALYVLLEDELEHGRAPGSHGNGSLPFEP